MLNIAWSYLSEAACSQLDIRLTSLVGFLLKAMQYINRFRTCGQKDYAIGPGRVPHANLFHSRTHSFHRLPVRRFEASLHKIQIETGIPTRLIGESLQIIVAGPTNCSGLRVTSAPILYSYLYNYTTTYIKRSDLA